MNISRTRTTERPVPKTNVMQLLIKIDFLLKFEKNIPYNRLRFSTFTLATVPMDEVLTSGTSSLLGPKSIEVSGISMWLEFVLSFLNYLK